MSGLTRARAVCAAAIFLTCAIAAPAGGNQPALLWDHGSHTQPSPDERALRELLARYSAGDVEGAVRGALSGAPRWIPTAVDATTRRTEEEIAYHRQPENRLGATRDERLERYLRADRLNVLLLAAALQLDVSGEIAAVDPAGWHIVGSERAIDGLYALRRDFEQNSSLPWPVAIDEPWEIVNHDARDSQRSAEWPAVHAFVRRWYGAAVSRLQGARGLS